MSTLIADQIVEAANHHPPDIPVLVRWHVATLPTRRRCQCLD
jgi:hypothetical protein